MEKIEKNVIVELGFLNRLILGAKYLVLKNNGIYLGDKLLEYPKPLQRLQYKRGLVFDKLILSEVKYRFIKNKTLRALLGDLDSQRIQYWAPRYNEHFNQLVSASEKFENYLSTFNRYIRKSQQDNWIERLNEPINLLDKPGRTYATN